VLKFSAVGYFFAKELQAKYNVPVGIIKDAVGGSPAEAWLVGTTGYQYPPRKYDFAPGVLKAGKNVITVRLISNGGRGGFTMGKEYRLVAGGQTIDLKGDWQYKLGATMPPTPGTTTFQY
nr:hypothetical protein [Tanacetum cinerariifolium]